MRYSLEAVLALLFCLALAGRLFMAPPTGHFEERKTDFAALGQALEKYRQDHGAYPESAGWDGYYAPWGKAGPDWIKGLAPDYIAHLPYDPRGESAPTRQYYYKSDGKDYKLIAHHVEDCDKAKGDPLVHVDPARDCFAYGVWTPNARLW
ncbi:MAG: hypothetical protein HQK81_15450 [Desulfovibrionaceae bacterium]|nr:hypothetical protein [Desulfovibrionaceae bacterium]MBF0515438.1 hypothetical protein [Desulfovibrionaceae bacterium]